MPTIAHRKDPWRLARDGAPTFPSREAAEAYLAGFSEGRTLQARVDPRGPERRQLGDSRIPARRLGLTLFLLAMAAFALFLSLR